MKALARQLCDSAKRKPSLRTERRNIVLHRKEDYRRCLKQLSIAGIKPVKVVDSLNFICYHADRASNWKQLHGHPRVAYVEKDLKVKSHVIGHSAVKTAVNKARIPWNVSRVRAPEAWKTANFGSGIKVAIVDTGIARHPDLRIAGGVNTLDGKSFADDNGHGTHVAGITAATGSRRIYGVAPKVKLYAVKVLDATGTGFISDIVEGIDWCLARGIKIMNMSFGLSGDSQLLRDAVRKARSQGAVMIASAGNSGTMLKRIDAPARYPETIAVAATTRGNRVAYFSSRGRGVDIAAPGVHILSTWLGGTYRSESGTSMSSPHVTGAAALLRRINPRLSASEVSQRLKKAALKITGGSNAVGRGLLQIAPAARLLSGKARVKHRH
ncbi:S8 family peptidase [Cohnella silvisoli]|uniref:S8 family peptidase n=1 Tax=Cohnella silvisoli TaxID=2873699 RepID=A0ABV1KSE3_9BACL|nr:S8 family peptidase [Cohnella silvisoli]MCD9021277.1 S8 family peptidase [Cohnella silvisoli]